MQCGAIGSIDVEVGAYTDYKFQFQYGAIWRFQGIIYLNLQLNFNSSMVRLNNYR